MHCAGMTGEPTIDIAGMTGEPTIDIAVDGSWCLRRLVLHHMASVLSGFNWNYTNSTTRKGMGSLKLAERKLGVPGALCGCSSHQLQRRDMLWRPHYRPHSLS